MHNTIQQIQLESVTMRKNAIRLLTLLTPLTALAVVKETRTAHRLHEASIVFEEIMAAPDKGIPTDLLAKSHCIVIVPGLKKGAFLVGGAYGKGFVSCRNSRGWAAPGAIRVEGGSFGFQAGGSETDLILLVMNARGAQRLLTTQFTLGAEGAVAAGPVGRSSTAQTDAGMRAEILSWSRSRGVFAGIAVQGATLRQDSDDNREMYGRSVDNRELVSQGIAAPRPALKLLALLNIYSPKEHHP
jgi:lipid-binding SYLF domain-containing protein